jgi:DNA (cytosine-5)-methyltransferase 1
MFTISKAHSHAVAQPIAYNIAPGKGALKDDIHVTTADATKTLDASGSNPAMHQGGAAILQPIAFSGQMSNPQTDVDMTQTLGAKNPMAVAFGGDIARTLQARHDSSPCADRAMDVIATAMAVRRLTPVECERLQGFGDNYTDIQPRGKATPDGPRYKALGNSMAVPVMAWIGKRIQEVDRL